MNILSILILISGLFHFGFAQGKEYSQKVILWPTENEGDPEFQSRIHTQLIYAMQEHPHYSFLKTDSLKLIAEIHNFHWPIENQLMRDSLAKILQVRWQFEFETGSHTQEVSRNSFFVMADEKQSYEAVLRVLDEGRPVFEGRAQSDTLLELGWCGLLECVTQKRPADQQLAIKEKLLQKAIEKLMIDAYPALRRKE